MEADGFFEIAVAFHPNPISTAKPVVFRARTHSTTACSVWSRHSLAERRPEALLHKRVRINIPRTGVADWLPVVWIRWWGWWRR